MSFTDKGYETRRFPEIVESIRQQIETRTGTPITSDPSSVIAILNSIVADQVSTVENSVQALSNNLDIYKAEDVYLDKLVRYIGLSRLAAQPARGQLKVTRNSESVIQSSTSFSTQAGIQFICPTVSTSLSSCNSFLISPVAVTNGVEFTLTLNGASFSKTAGSSDTSQSIVDHFVTEIQSVLGFTCSNIANELKVSIPDEDLNDLSLTSFGNFLLKEVSAFNSCESVDKRFLQIAPNTVTEVVTSNSSILRANNPLSFVNGRDLETDEELRARYELSFANSGNTTFDNILAELLQLPNVTDAFIIENKEITPSNGLPPKSYNCVVVNGDPANIADKIWETKPIGVETHGSIISTVKDIKGGTHTVEWDRPTETYIFVEVTFSKYNEEEFPSNGNALIREAVLEYGQSLTLDNDVIPERFLGNIYRAVDGVDSVSIRVGKTYNVNDTTPSGGYQTTRIPISDRELPLFTSAKINVLEV